MTRRSHPGLHCGLIGAAAVAAGAVRAMELDINPAFVTFAAFDDGPR